MDKIGQWWWIVHDNTLKFFEIAKHLTYHNNLDYFVYGHLVFMYSYGGRSVDKKVNDCQETEEWKPFRSSRIQT